MPRSLAAQPGVGRPGSPVSSVDPLLELDGVGVARGGVTLLEEITFKVARGEIHGLVGHNGAGKSTLIQAILGLVPFRGRIRFHWAGDGRVGYVPQRLHLDPHLPITVGDFLAAPRQRWPVCWGQSQASRAHTLQMLAGVGLAGHEHRPLGALSGGELQRVLFAHALDPQPELLILDEAAAGLDPESERRFEALVKRAQAQGVTVLLVAHDRGQLGRLCDQVTVLARGRVSPEVAA